jgi:hypothetical protein
MDSQNEGPYQRWPSREVAMDNWTFGITMLVVGMGGTLTALGLLSLLMNALKKLFPFKEEQPK